MKHETFCMAGIANDRGLCTNILPVTALVGTEARNYVMVGIPYKDALSQRRRSGKVSAIMPVTVG
jgi:hypothetical protein